MFFLLNPAHISENNLSLHHKINTKNSQFMEKNQIVIYQTEDGQTQIDVRLEKETVWLTTAQMSLLFDREESNIRRHVINVFKEGELERDNNVQKIHVNGVKKPVPIYNLDVIISVGYRVKSKSGTAFRIWARNVIKDYLLKGYAINKRIHSIYRCHCSRECL